MGEIGEHLMGCVLAQRLAYPGLISASREILAAIESMEESPFTTFGAHAFRLLLDIEEDGNLLQSRHDEALENMTAWVALVRQVGESDRVAA